MSAARPLALITAGWRRVGAAIARALADDGWDLALHAHTAQAFDAALEADLAARGALVIRLAADLADDQAVLALVPQAAQAGGRAVRLLVNNASLFGSDNLASVNAAELARHMAVNHTAPVLLARALADGLGANETGAVVHILDQRVVNPVADQLAYTLSKQALHASVRTLARALAPLVRVNAVAPGPVLPTADYADEHWRGVARLLPLQRLPEPAQVAASVVHLARAEAITGQTLFVDGGANLEAFARDFLYLTPDV